MRELRVWWIPQVPMKPFYAEVETLREAKLLLVHVWPTTMNSSTTTTSNLTTATLAACRSSTQKTPKIARAARGSTGTTPRQMRISPTSATTERMS